MGLKDEGPEGTLDIRVIAIFIIIAASVMGAAPPLYIKAFKNPCNGWARMLRAAGAGIVLCLALVHVAPYAYEQFGALSDLVGLDPPYNCAGAAIVFGFMLMMAIEACAHGMDGHSGYEHGHGHGHCHGHIDMHANPAAASKECLAELESGVGEDLKSEKQLAADRESSERDAAHLRKRQVAAHLFELGCAVHSVIIGLALGVMTDDRGVARNYFVALVFHQLVEGVALGSFIAIANIGRVKSWLFIIVYALTVAVGIAVGIAVEQSYDGESVAALATQGTLNGVSVGILLYMATIQMVGEDFTPESLSLIKEPKFRYGCFASFFVFSGVMTFIAIWA